MQIKSHSFLKLTSFEKFTVLKYIYNPLLRKFISFRLESMHITDGMLFRVQAVSW